MKAYLVWYKTLSGKYIREIRFSRYDKALSLFESLERDFKALEGINENGKYILIKKFGF